MIEDLSQVTQQQRQERVDARMGIPKGSRNANDILKGSLAGDDYGGEEETPFHDPGSTDFANRGREED